MNYQCETCGAINETVKLVNDPYLEDLYGTIKEVYLCDKCLEDRANDI